MARPRPCLRVPLVALAGLVLTACGGGEDATPPAPPPPARLLVDADRNGVIDEADRPHRATWDATRGAVFLANVDDDDDDDAVDAADAVVNGAEDLADLAWVVVEPWAAAPTGATGRLAIVNEVARDRVRLFKRAGDAWAVFDPATDALTDAELRAGVELGIESRDFPTADWDGAVALSLVVADAAGAERGADRVALRAAPFLMANPLGETIRVYTSEATRNAGSRDFIHDLEGATTDDGMELYKINAQDAAYATPGQGADVWTQDFMEFGWTGMPRAEGGVHGMHVVLRSPARDRRATRVTEREILARDFGYVWKHSPAAPRMTTYDLSLDSFGNLEATPPYRNGDASFPVGRVILGRTDRRHGDPALLEFLEAQRAQGPVLQVDTSWLWVGHVDEVISFVPARGTARGWKLLIASPRLARAQLQAMVAQRAANADAVMFEGQSWYEESDLPPGVRIVSAQQTVGQILSDGELMAFNQRTQATIDGIREQLQREIGLADDEIVEIPFLFKNEERGRAGALMPDTANLLYYNNVVVIARPHGAVVGEVDAQERDLTDRLGALGLTVRFAEEWDILHAAGGEVHCGTNALRRIPSELRWWEVTR